MTDELLADLRALADDMRDRFLRRGLFDARKEGPWHACS